MSRLVKLPPESAEMPKKKKPKKKRYSKPRTSKGNKDNASGSRKPSAKRLLQVIGKIFLILLAIWGAFLTTWITFNPRVFVQPAVALDPNNPANTPFVVQNQGYISIHDVKFSCSIKYLTFPGGIRAEAQIPYDNSFSNPKHMASIIAPGEQYSELLPFIDMEHNKIEESDIAIILSFKPIKWLPWRCKTKHRFVSTQSKDGLWHWFPQPVDK